MTIVSPNCASRVRVLATALAGLFVTLAIAPQTVAAQATVRGRVLDRETGSPLVGANISLRRSALLLTTDSAGKFLTQEFPAGDVTVTVQMLGYQGQEFRIRVPDNGEVEKVFSLDF